jgi:hypothetical protein
VTYTYPARRTLFVTGRFLTVVPAPVSRLPVKDSALSAPSANLPTTRKPIAIVTPNNRTPKPVAELFMNNARDGQNSGCKDPGLEPNRASNATGGWIPLQPPAGSTEEAG